MCTTSKCLALSLDYCDTRVGAFHLTITNLDLVVKFQVFSCLNVSLFYFVIRRAADALEKLVSETVYYVRNEKLNISFVT